MNIYLKAKFKNKLHNLRLQPLSSDDPVLKDDDITKAVEQAHAKQMAELAQLQLQQQGLESTGFEFEQMEDEGEEEDEEEEDTRKEEEFILKARTMPAFYAGLLQGMRLWKRPPHEHCSRCTGYVTTKERIAKLSAALTSTDQSSGVIVKEAGGEQEAWGELRQLEAKITDLRSETVIG